MDINLKDIPSSQVKIIDQKAQAQGDKRSAYLRKLVALITNPHTFLVQIESNLLSELKDRESSPKIESIIKRDLDRYYKLLRQAKIPPFSEQELRLMIETFDGILLEFAMSPQHQLYHSVQNAIALDQLDQKWQIDRGLLLEKLENLNDLQAAYLLDGIEKYWNQGNSKENALQVTGLQAHVKQEFKPTHVVVQDEKAIALLMVLEEKGFTKRDWHLSNNPEWEIKDDKIFFQGIKVAGKLVAVA